jgi:Fe-S-cluster containining protein
VSGGARLPIVPTDDANPCFGCTTGCCREYDVELSGFDLWRLVRGADVPWRALAEVRRAFTAERAAAVGAFVLDESAHRYSLWLRRHRGGACVALLELPGQQMRCGAHAHRPLACRLYPYRPAVSPTAGAHGALVGHALCPPRSRQRFEAAQAGVRPAIEAELVEHALWMRLVRRWNEIARGAARAQPLDVEELVAWVLAAYDRLEPLRASSPPTAGAAIAGAFIDGLEVPALVGAGY